MQVLAVADDDKIPTATVKTVNAVITMVGYYNPWKNLSEFGKSIGYCLTKALGPGWLSSLRTFLRSEVSLY